MVYLVCLCPSCGMQISTESKSYLNKSQFNSPDQLFADCNNNLCNVNHVMFHQDKMVKINFKMHCIGVNKVYDVEFSLNDLNDYRNNTLIYFGTYLKYHTRIEVSFLSMNLYRDVYEKVNNYVELMETIG